MADNKASNPGNQPTKKKTGNKKTGNKKTGNKKPARDKDVGQAAGKNTARARNIPAATASAQPVASSTASKASTTIADNSEPRHPDHNQSDHNQSGQNQSSHNHLDQQTSANQPARTNPRSGQRAGPKSSAPIMFAVLLAIFLGLLASSGLALLIINKGFGYLISTPAQMTAASPALLSIKATLDEQQQTLTSLRADLEQQQTPIEAVAQLQSTLNGMSARIDGLASSQDNLQVQLAQRLAHLETAQQHNEQALADMRAAQQQIQSWQNSNQAQMRSEFVRLQLQQRLDEIATVLRFGQQQLLLNGNRGAALSAYDLALNALDSLPGDHAFVPAQLRHEMRQALIAERSKLAAMEPVDMDALVADLHGLADAAADWPLQQGNSEDSDTGTAAGQADASWLQKLQDSLSHLVKVRSTTTPQLSIDEQQKLKRHLQLQLRTAALLALQQREDAYRNTVQSSISFIQTWFAGDNRGVAAAIQSLQRIANAELLSQWPRQNQSMQLLGQLQSSASARDR